MKFSNVILGLTVCTSLSLSTDRLAAQWNMISGSKDRVRGNTHALSRHHGDGLAISSSNHAYMRAKIDNSIRVLGMDIGGGGVSTEVYNNRRTGTRRANLVIRAGNHDIRNERFATTISRNLFEWELKLFPQDPSITIQFTPWLPVTISANAGVILRADVYLSILPAANEVRTGGRTYAMVFGAARVMIGLSCLGAGVEARLEFGRTELNVSLIARTNYTGGMSELTFTDISLKLIAFVTVGVRLFETTLIRLTGTQWRFRSLLRA